MTEIDDSILMAYVDGELEDEMVRQVERHIANDATLRERADAFRQSALVVRSAFDLDSHDAAPDRTGEFILASVSPAESGRKLAPAAFRWPVAAAASILLVALGYIAGFLTPVAGRSDLQNVVVADARSNAVRAQTVQNTLQTVKSGTAVVWQASDGASGSVQPLRTFRNKDGRYCREYKDILVQRGKPETVPETVYEVACRGTDGIWTPSYRLIWLNPPDKRA